MVDAVATESEINTKTENKAIELITARDETGAKLQIPFRQKSVWGYPNRQSSSRFTSSGVRENISTEEFLPINVDSRLKANDVITLKNNEGSLFHYQIIAKPGSATLPNKEDDLKSDKDTYLKRLSLDKYQELKMNEVPISQKETETTINNQTTKSLAVEMINS